MWDFRLDDVLQISEKGCVHPNMKQTHESSHSIATKAVALSLALLTGPLSSKGLAQATNTIVLSSGTPGIITESKPSEPIRPIPTPIDPDDNADKVLADIAIFQAQQSTAEATKFSDPKHPTQEELASLCGQLRALVPQFTDITNRISRVLSADSQRGDIQSEKRQSLKLYLKAYKDQLEDMDKWIAEITADLNKKSEPSPSVASVSTATPTPTFQEATPTPTPRTDQSGFLGSHRGDVQDAGIAIGVGAAALGLIEGLKHLLSN